LHFGKTEIFLQKGLDRFLLICPSGHRSWDGLSFAKPVAAVQNLMGIAFRFLLRSASFGGRGRSASFGEHFATNKVRSWRGKADSATARTYFRK
jgi:hypothetical protein